MSRVLADGVTGKLCTGAAARAAVAWSLLLACAAGCADLSYEGIRLGMRQAECSRQFEAEAVERTELGLCALRRDLTGRTDALVVLLSPDGVVAGKLQATFIPQEPRWGRPAAFRLRGQLDPKASALGATGPVDSLRAVLEDLAGYRGSRAAMQAYAWVAAGLIRMLERWPHMGELASAYPHLIDALEQVPGGGESRVRVDRQGIYWFEYEQGALR